MSRWQYLFDSAGNPVKQPPKDLIGYTIMPVKESHSYAPSTPRGDALEEHVYRAGRISAVIETLTGLEREVLWLQGKLRREQNRFRIPAGDLSHYIRDGHTYIPGSDETEERAGMPSVTTVEVIGWEVSEGLDYERIAERLCIAVSAVHEAVKSAHRKLRKIER